ncbi:hypothetical protein PENTCL1PPCAC_29493, partial [Pristionchus entomophagus]
IICSFRVFERESDMHTMRRLSLHHHTTIANRKRRLSSLKGAQQTTNLLAETQLFNCKAGIAYIASLLGVVIYSMAK